MEPHLPVSIVRAKGVDDLEAIAAFYPSKSQEERAEMVRRSLLPELLAQELGKRIILLARWRDRIVGTAQVVWNGDDSPLLLAPGAAMIHHLRTHPDLQRRGVGTQLLDVSRQLAKSRGMVRLMLGVEPENHHARRFYQTAGFEDCGEYRGENGERILAMRIDLT